MSPSVTALRNEIRVSVGRYEREVSSAFTKEALAAICEAVGHETPDGRLPPKAEMRATILRAVGELAADEERADRPFRKAELEAIVAALRESE